MWMGKRLRSAAEGWIHDKHVFPCSGFSRTCQSLYKTPPGATRPPESKSNVALKPSVSATKCAL